MCILTYIDKTGDKVSYFFSLRGKNNGQIYTICIYTKIFGWKKWFGNKVINKKCALGYSLCHKITSLEERDFCTSISL